jgi:16S rRNA (cytidine1402-2'-O)-methyltransferase
VHGHNESSRLVQVLGWLAEGRTVALVSDAGTPALSDPGQKLVAAAAAQGATVSAVPGPSSMLGALVVSGLPTARFCVEGFLPRKGTARRERLEALAREERTAVVLEAPGRLVRTLDDLARACGPRPVAVVRELTKVHEEVWRGTLPEAAREFAGRQVRGEVVVVLGGAEPAEPASEESIAEALREHLAAGDSPRQAAEAVTGRLGVPRRRAYEVALALRGASSSLG